MSDLLQETTGLTKGDLKFTNNALTIVDGPVETGQRISQRLNTGLGEWFLDLTVGVPYFERILQKNVNPRTAEDAVKREIILTTGVTRLESFSLLVDPQLRKAKIDFHARSREGEISGSEII